jgi:flagellar biosynthetic protein FliR
VIAEFDAFVTALPADLLRGFFGFLLVLCRFSGMVLAAPFFGAETVPMKVKVGITAMFALCVTPLLPLPDDALLAWSTRLVGLVVLCAGEVGIGLVFGVAVNLFFAAVQLAGQILGQQIGLALASVLDPISNVQISPLGQLKYVLAVGVFIAADLHLELVGVIRHSFAQVPLGSTLLWPQVGELMARGLGSSLWHFALRVALPGMLGLFLVTVGLGFLSRSVPEINIFIIGFGLQALVGLWLLYLAVPLLMDLFREGAVEFLRNARGLLTWVENG